MSEAELGGKVGRYEIVRRIGGGGMGVVFEAVDTESGERVALKRVRDRDADRQDRKARFAREAKLTHAIDHPGVVRVREVILDGDDLFLVMELVPGESLRARLDALHARGETLEVPEALRIARGVAEAVAHAHKKGVIHRDLKPENVMLSGGETRVLDFGLAKLRETEGGLLYDAETQSNVTEEGHVLGTPAYMAPEQARGQEIGFRADVFSLGVVLYEMLTGERPFVGSSTIDVIVAVSRDDPRPPSAKNPRVAGSLDELVLSCLSKKADARPTMQALAGALRDIEAGAGGGYARGARRNRRWVVAAASVVILAGVVLGTGAQLSKRNPVPKAFASAAATAVTELPSPRSDVPDALAAYRTALQDERDGAEDSAQSQLENATKLDPALAAAHLRLALRGASLEAQDARAHFAAAVAHRDRLAGRDAELLDAMRPVFQRDPPDVNAWASAMQSLSDKHPGDAELALELARARDALGDFRGGKDAAARAAAIDPRFALALATLSQEQAYLGEFAPARATIEQCIAAAPSASWCMWVGEFMDGQEGRCDANEKSARDRIAADPTIPDGYKALAYSLAAIGRPERSVREASDQAVLRLAEGFPRERLRLSMGMRIDVMQGRFEDAMTKANELRALLTSRADAADHSMPAWLEADLALELGNDARAAAIAKDFLDRKDVWQKNAVANDYALAYDLTPQLLAVARHAGSMSASDYDVAVTAWRGKWDAALRGGWRPYLWVYGYASGAKTEDEGKAAVQALDRFGAIPPFIVDGDLPEASVGRALWLGGRASEAIVHLRRAASSCDVLTHPLAWVRAHAWLAEALASSGDAKGACGAYDVVLSRWGGAKRSVTVDAARAQMRKLGCGNEAARVVFKRGAE